MLGFSGTTLGKSYFESNMLDNVVFEEIEGGPEQSALCIFKYFAVHIIFLKISLSLVSYSFV
jgi:hypothetical protein